MTRLGVTRPRLGLVAAAAVLVTAGALIGVQRHQAALSPGALLTSAGDFTLSGTATNLAPGVPGTLVLAVSNPQPVQLSLRQVTVSVSPDPSGCSALTNLTLGGATFTGGPPSVTITGSPLPQTVPAKSGSVNGSATVQLPILVARTSPNACQNVTFPFVYSGQALYTAATTTTLTSSSNPSLYGQPVTFTATVAATPASANPAPGSVTFFVCTSPANLAAGSPASACAASTALGPALPLGSGGQASLTTSALAPGAFPIFATFTPTDATSYAPSASTTLTQTVGFSRPCITTTINGSLTVATGQSICISSPGRVNGTVTVQSGGALFLSGATVNGGLNATGAAALRFCGSTLSGSVSVSGTAGFATIGDGGDDGTPACAGNTVSGSLSVANGRGGFEAGGNHIGLFATFTGNTGTGPVTQDATPEIEGNTIVGALSCSSNSPAPTNGGQTNTVAGVRSGQCAGASF